MNNAEKFKQIFGLYATELWSMPESDFLEWLNRDVETTQIDHIADSNKKVEQAAEIAQNVQDEDLISKLSEIRSEYNCFDEDGEPQYRALSEAIRILSQLADGDTISRQAAIDALTHEWDGMVTSVFDVIKSLPSAQPEQRWVPCSERLPEKNCRCLTTNEAWGSFEVDWNAWIDGQWLYPNEKPIAWMPLPEPYRGGDE